MHKITEVVTSNVVVQAVLSILFGLLLAIWPETTTITFVYILAACLAISAISSFITYFRGRKEGTSSQGTLLIGLFLIILAIVVFIFPEAVAGLFTIIFGALLILSGLINAFRSIKLRIFGGSIWIVMLIVSLLIVAGGIVIIANPFETAVTFILVLGILLIVKGIIDLIIYYILSKNEKPIKTSR